MVAPNLLFYSPGEFSSQASRRGHGNGNLCLGPACCHSCGQTLSSFISMLSRSPRPLDASNPTSTPAFATGSGLQVLPLSVLTLPGARRHTPFPPAAFDTLLPCPLSFSYLTLSTHPAAIILSCSDACWSLTTQPFTRALRSASGGRARVPTQIMS